MGEPTDALAAAEDRAAEPGNSDAADAVPEPAAVAVAASEPPAAEPVAPAPAPAARARPVVDPALRPIGQVILGWTITVAIAAAAAGVIDGLWSWSRAGQHLPGVLARVRWLVYLAASYAVAGAVAGAIAAALGLAWSRLTRLGDVLRFARAEHERRRAADPGDAV